jgi:hypothetical protein
MPALADVLLVTVTKVESRAVLDLRIPHDLAYAHAVLKECEAAT